MIDFSQLLLNYKENVKLEVKLAQGGIPKSVWESYSAFANTYGGIILLGVGEKENTKELFVNGVDNAEKIISDLWNTLNNNEKISNNVLLEEQIYSLNHGGKVIVVMEVPRADRNVRPVYLGKDIFKNTFRRNHEGDYHCSREEVLAMLRDQSEISNDNKLLDNILLSDLNQDCIARYRTIFRNYKPDHVWNSLTDEQFLVKIGAARRGKDARIHPNLAGLLFFGDFITITDELPNYFLDYKERLAIDSRWSDRICSSDATWSGNIFDFYFRIIDRLTADVQTPFKLDSNTQRISNTPVHEALREVLVNALIHADYYGRQGIVVEKEFKKIKISNPGTFRISVADAISGGISDARNSRIFNIFSLINIGERAGSGLCDVFSIWKKYGYNVPKIEESMYPDRTTITMDIEIAAQAPDTTAQAPDTAVQAPDTAVQAPDSTAQAPDSMNDLSKQETEIIAYMQANGSITAKKVEIILGVKDNRARTILRTLVAKKILDRQGKARSTIYALR